MKTFKEYIKENEEEPEIFYPNGVYISVKLSENTKQLIAEYQNKYLKGQEISDYDSLHCTLIYSKEPYKEEIPSADYKAIGTFKEFSLFGPDNNILVAEINSQDLLRRNEELVKKYGFTSDYDEYKSHITLAYGVDNIDLNSLPAMDFAFEFIDESVEQLDDDWVKKTSSDTEGSETLLGKALNKIDKDKE